MKKLGYLIFLIALASLPMRAQQRSANLTTHAAACASPPAASTGYIFIPVSSNNGALTINLAGTWSGVISFFSSADAGTTWQPIYSVQNSNSSSTQYDTYTGNASFQFNAAAYDYVCAAFTTASSGTVVVSMKLSQVSARANGGGGGSGCVPAGSSGQILKDSGSGGCSDSSLTDNGTNVTGTEPLLVSNVVDGRAPVTITTGTTATLGAGTYSSGYTLNQEGTAGTGVTYTLPATAKGLQYCVANSGTTSVVNAGVLTVYPPLSSYVILNGVVNTIGGGGTHGVASGGAAGDAACFVAIDATHWQVWIGKGTWTEN